MPKLPANLTRMLKASPPAVVFAPGASFFTRRLELPDEVQPSEIEGFIELSLEGISPFPTEQLYYGYATAGDGSAVFLYAAYRRRFSPEIIRSWSEAAFVVPDFLPALRHSFDRDTTVFLETAGNLSILGFRAGRELPVGILSRPVPDLEGNPDLEAWRESQRRSASSGGLLFADEVLLDGSWNVGEKTNSLTFAIGPAPAEPEDGVVQVLVETPQFGGGDESIPVDAELNSETAQAAEAAPVSAEGAGGQEASGSPVGLGEVTLLMDDLWTMDIRDPEFVSGRRQAVRIDTYMWRGILGIAAALMILLAGELILLGGKVSLGVIGGLTTRRQGEVERIEDRQAIVERLAEFDRSNSVPFEMLKAINTARPRTVYFTRAATEGLNNLVIDAATQNVADVNQYESNLRSLPEVQEVEVRNLKPRDDGTTFTLVVTFRPGAFDNGNGGIKTASLR